MNIKLTNINYRISSDGDTSEIGTSFSGYEGNENLTASMPLTIDDLESGTTLDDLSRKQIETLGRKKLADAVAVQTTENGEPAN
ncbi:hypothetical protein [Weissella paramesenteroides]|uniref:hypothetical protein n=1 Tax=Weissella paramesenteroides TaxID=1249 RepID=UPI0012385435|nr:hypothetical protein [Weissella paramesenteroides]KAA8455235.1 hypothetical protein FKV86_08025 [Weissella paramesenteroides]KAA8456304.1 hypothetical protein FKV78_08500 [Weissella paramesenteroides]KAA8458205.1 hypothetical protein FKV82_07185 [Weissella paramesenteroides]KAA8460196.1 hypothetical protein FKV80_08915 [Weissella paramesenteroides]KAA8461538.1 hypothetical protein FKV85_07895 [Weissella paramesenteroides]